MAAASLVLAGTAQADRISPPAPPPPPVDDGGGGGGGYDPGGGTDPAKEFEVGGVEVQLDYQPGEDLYLTPDQQASGLWVLRGTLHAEQRMPFRDSYLRSYFKDEYSYAWPSNTSAVIRKGQSHSLWLGINPYNADRVEQTDHLWTTGLTASFSSSGFGFQVHGNDIYWSFGRNNDWRIHHYYQGLRWEGIGLFRIGHELTSHFRFGPTAITLAPRDTDNI